MDQIMQDRAAKGLPPRKINEKDLISKYYSLWLAVEPKDNTKKLMGHPLLSEGDHLLCTDMVMRLKEKQFYWAVATTTV